MIFTQDEEKYSLAVEKALEAVRENPDSIVGYHLLITLSIIDADYERAEKGPEIASELSGDDPVLIMDRAMYLIGTEQYDGCLAYIEEKYPDPEAMPEEIRILAKMAGSRKDS